MAKKKKKSEFTLNYEQDGGFFFWIAAGFFLFVFNGWKEIFKI